MASDLAEVVVSAAELVVDPLGDGADGGGKPFEFEDTQFDASVIKDLTLHHAIKRLRKLRADHKLRKSLLPVLEYLHSKGVEHEEGATAEELDDLGPDDTDGGDDGDNDEDYADYDDSNEVSTRFDNVNRPADDDDNSDDNGDAELDGVELREVRVEVFNDFLDDDPDAKTELGQVYIFGQRIPLPAFHVLVWYIEKYEPTVRAILIQDCQLTDDHAIALGYAIRSCTSLKVVNLDGNKKIRHMGLAALCVGVQECGTVTTFIAQDCGFNDTHGYLGKHMIQANAALVKLDLSGNKLSHEMCSSLGPALAENFCLLHLDLHNNHIGTAGLECLAEALKRNIVLEELMVGDNEITAQGGEVLGAALAQNHTLKTLWIQRNRLGNTGVEALAAGMHNDTALRRLRLNMNNIGNPGLEALGQSIAEKELPLQKLHLQDNIFDARGFVPFVEAIAGSETLFELDVARNKLDDECGAAIGQMLATNTSLETLSLDGNNIGDVGAVDVSEGLKSNSTLVHLNLSRNAVGDRGAELLGFVLASEKNTSLKTLELDENPIGDKTATDGWLKRANRRGATGKSQVELLISTGGTQIAKGSLDSFGVKIAISETVTSFSIVMLVFAVVMNWFDLATDILVVEQMFTEAYQDELSFVWFAFALTFLVLPTLYMMVFMSTPWKVEDRSLWSRVKNALLSLCQLRVAAEAYRSWELNETTVRFGSIRVVEVAGESGPQAFLQIIFLVHEISRPGGDSDVANGAVLLSVALSLVVLGNTFADLFDKEFIMRRSSVNLEGWALFKRLIPCWIFHILQFSFRAMTIGLITSMFDLRFSVPMIFGMILLRVLIWWASRSKRSGFFAILVTFMANSAWDKRAAVIAGIIVSTLEAAGVTVAVWFRPDYVLTGDDVHIPYGQNVNFQNIDPVAMTSLMSAIFFTYNLIFIVYIYPMHQYTDMHFRTGNKDGLEAIKTAQVFNAVVQDIEGRRNPQDD
ncbi:NACHT, LRR and PYD domains-containing protein 1 [Hondaea fermentalgiana]|uniref:NACHT, LRR and PYD domains-containing protein 1 n=1 Tax=Hondaea fermentalgiana TaxID=2315210 RepID=A0A2R5GC28_9STRA|nr:NACHT, LRR and PYD domains-containing protein 1 [Hondaea fermentalgiana]|eukprot:GBG28105.1 NACHT, LRR and PYD domains-containing protein 1 [Hondaea fermentalgiana]